jgi:catalase
LNPFDLTKVWPHRDYPLIKVGTMTLNRNPENFFGEIEQAAFSPGNTVPGIGLSPDKMLLGRAFAYNDAHRARIGTNFHQLPVNRPQVADHNTFQFDGNMTYEHTGAAPVYAPNSFGRTWSDDTGPVHDGWESDGEMVRSAYTLRPDDDDFGQAGILVRNVFSVAERDDFVATVAAALSSVTGEVLERAFEYWRHVDAETGRRIEQAVRSGAAGQGAEGMGETGDRARARAG